MGLVEDPLYGVLELDGAENGIRDARLEIPLCQLTRREPYKRKDPGLILHVISGLRHLHLIAEFKISPSERIRIPGKRSGSEIVAERGRIISRVGEMRDKSWLSIFASDT